MTSTAVRIAAIALLPLCAVTCATDNSFLTGLSASPSPFVATSGTSVTFSADVASGTFGSTSVRVEVVFVVTTANYSEVYGRQSEILVPSTTTSFPLVWDGRSNDGYQVNPGLYVATVSIRVLDQRDVAGTVTSFGGPTAERETTLVVQ